MEPGALAGGGAAARQQAAAASPALVLEEPSLHWSEHGSTRVRYFERSQHDIVPGRHADVGSSCRALFASAVVAGVIAEAAPPAAERLEVLLAKCVSAWDEARQVAGAEPLQVLQTVLGDGGFEAKLNCCVTTPSALSTMWSRSMPPRAYVLTAIPRDACGMRPTGDTFAVCHLRDGVHLIDSHRHCTERGTLGMLWARSSSLGALHGWLFSPSGLLEQLRCRADFLEVTAVEDFWLAVAAAAAPGTADANSDEESESSGDVVFV